MLNIRSEMKGAKENKGGRKVRKKGVFMKATLGNDRNTVGVLLSLGLLHTVT